MPTSPFFLPLPPPSRLQASRIGRRRKTTRQGRQARRNANSPLPLPLSFLTTCIAEPCKGIVEEEAKRSKHVAWRSPTTSSLSLLLPSLSSASAEGEKGNEEGGTRIAMLPYVKRPSLTYFPSLLEGIANSKSGRK